VLVGARVWVRRCVAGALVLGLPLSARSSRADPNPPSAADLAAARQLGEAGAILADQGHCKEAIDKLQRAADLYAAPTIVGRLGECRVKLGQIVKGTEELERVVHQKLGPDAPKPFTDAQERARRELADALPLIAQLVIVVHAPKGVTPKVTVDDHPVPLALLGAPRPTDPGDRVVEAHARGCLPVDASVHLKPGGRRVVQLTLALDPNAPLSEEPEHASAPQRAVSADRDQASSGTRTAAYVLFGVAGVGIVTGSVLGGLAMQKEGVLSANCPNNHCSPAYQSDLNTGRALGTGATVAFGVGLAAAAAGAYFFFTSPTPEKTSGVHAGAWVGPGSAGLAGWF
jgi:hypothetical protein